VKGNVYMLVGAGANIAVQIGDEGVLVVDTGARGFAREVLAAIRSFRRSRFGGSSTRVRTRITRRQRDDLAGWGDREWQSRGDHCARRRACANDRDRRGRSPNVPSIPYFEESRDFAFNNEAVFLYHYPKGHTGGDSFVYFRGSDVLVSGDTFLTTTYPVIDTESGGGVDGFLASLNKLLAIAVPNYLQEGGTYVIPGHGRISDEADLVEYRDMVYIIRDRIQDMVKKGMTLDQVKGRAADTRL
jgi:glyoxylase-like metal-dependent hydrolase (beta-lactamase superfamily II)